MTRSLLTGATGFVGACLARRLLEEGHEVHLLVRQEHQGWRIAEIRNAVQLHEADLEDLDGVSAVMNAVRPTSVFHLAAYGAYPGQRDLQRMIRTNVVGTTNLLQASFAAGVETLINTGSSSEYGYKNHPPVESESLEPNSYYAVTKVAATLLCQQAARSSGIPMPTLRLYSVYGPYEEPSRLVPALVLNGLRGELPPLAQPDIARDYVYVNDVVNAYLLAAQTSHADPGGVYNIGTGVQTTLGEIVDKTRALLRVTAVPSWGSMAPRTWDTSTWVCDNSKAKSSLGWTPRHELTEGLRGFVEWVCSQPDRLTRYYHYLDERAS